MFASFIRWLCNPIFRAVLPWTGTEIRMSVPVLL